MTLIGSVPAANFTDKKRGIEKWLKNGSFTEMET
jgi:hypothetical protein